MTSLPRAMLWEFESSAGNVHRGIVESTHDYGGTDVPYIMRAACGSTLVLSGARLRAARTLNRIPADDETCPHGTSQAW